MTTFAPEAGRRMAVAARVDELDPLVALVVLLAPAPRVLPDVAPLGHVGHPEVRRDLVRAQRGGRALARRR